MEKFIWVQARNACYQWDKVPAKLYTDRCWSDIVAIVKRYSRLHHNEVVRVTSYHIPVDYRNLNGHYITA